jgi:hypothetical protein
MLTNKKIEELSLREGVKKIAVENFLYSINSNLNADNAYSNLDYDAFLYNWNIATVNAISEGIIEYFDLEIQ